MEKITLYIAEDGKEFRAEEDCLLHELRCFAQKMERDIEFNILLAAVLNSRAVDLFDEPSGEGFPTKLLDSFDRIGFKEEFRSLLLDRDIDAHLVVKHLDSFVDLGRILATIKNDQQWLIEELDRRESEANLERQSINHGAFGNHEEDDEEDVDSDPRIPDSWEGSPY
jgi:hypothetical protein